MVAGLESGLSLEDAFQQQAVASGTATAFTGRFSNNRRYRKIKSQVTITVLDGEEINENHRITNKRYNCYGFISV